MANVAETIVDTLVAAKVRRIYGVVGDSLNALTEALRRSKAIEWIGVRHEEVAAFAAGADAHVTGELAVLLGTVQQLTWTHNVGAAAQFTIELSRDAGTTWELVAPAAPASDATSGSYAWTVSAPKTDKARIRVTWTGGTANDKSDANFKIR